MGSWGTGIFENDDACDIRGEWRDGLIDGEDPTVLTQRIVQLFGLDIEDEEADDDLPGLWMALAAAQMETGRLQPHIRDKALEIIEAGGDIDLWEGDTTILQRRAAMEDLARQLRGPQPEPQVISHPRALGIPFAIGDAIHLRNPDNGAIAVVVGHADGYPKGILDPVIELVLWDGGQIPSTEQLATLPCLLTIVPMLRDDAPNRIRPQLRIPATHREDQIFGPHLGRIVATGVNRPPAGDHQNGQVAGGEVLTTWTSWPGIVAELGTTAHQHDIGLTRDTSRRAT